jgi:hypothetical protein
MTGEMCKDDVTREEFPLHFAVADAVPGASVEPWDVYQGPYIQLPGYGCYWLIEAYDGPSHRWDYYSELCCWWNEYRDDRSVPFHLEDKAGAVEAFKGLIEPFIDQEISTIPGTKL